MMEGTGNLEAALVLASERTRINLWTTLQDMDEKHRKEKKKHVWV